MPMYFITGAGTEDAARAVLVELGLSSAISDEGVSFSSCVNGPGGDSGMVLCGGSGEAQPTRRGYHAETQDWTVFEDGAYAIGIDRANPPTEAELRRGEIRGHWVEMADGVEWMVPIARRYDGRTLLPSRIVIKGDGVEYNVDDGYRDLWEFALGVWESLESKDGGEAERVVFNIDDREAIDVLCRALAVNYFVCPMLLSNVLQVFSKGSIEGCLWALIDWPSVMAMTAALKKNPEA